MSIKRNHIGLAVAATVVVAGAAFWLGTNFSLGNQKPTAAAPGHAGESGAGADSCCPPAKGEEADEHGHGHGGEGEQANLTPAEIEQKRCEHDIRQVDCQECRYELGVVKVDPSLTASLTKTAAVREGRLGRTLRLTGEVQYDQTVVVDVLPAAPGRIVAVKAHLGQKVRAGEVLAVIHSGDFSEAKATYLEAHTVAEVARQDDSRQEAISQSLEKLLAAAKDGPSAEIPAEILGEWKSKLVGAVARLRQAGIVLEREKSLVARQASSKAELETAEREMQTAQADYTALLEEIQLNFKLDRLKARSASRLAEAKLKAAEQRLHMFGLDASVIEDLPLDKDADNARFALLEVRAPRAGVVAAIHVTEGKFVETTQTLYTVADTSNVWVWCDLYERDLGPLHERLARGEKPGASVKVAAFDDVFPGAVDLIDSAVNEATRTIKLRVQVANGHGKLRPGMFAAVEVVLTEDAKVALVPRSAVLSDEGRTFAFVHWKDDLWLRRFVSVGRPQGEMVEVLSGLSIGEQVVADGGFLFKSDVLREKMGAGCAD